jgi:hypothetical protein
MLVCRQGVGQTTVLHDEKRDTVCESPLFIRTLTVQLYGTGIEWLRHGHNVYCRVHFQGVEELHRCLTIALLGESIPNFQQDGPRGY